MAAATIESVFVLVDRASGPVGRIRRELRGLERDATSAGRALDTVGGPRAARQLDDLAAQTRAVRDEVRGLPGPVQASGRALGALDRQMLTTSRSARAAAGSLGGLSTRTKAVGAAAVVALPAIQALGGAAGALAGSLSGAGLGAGAVGLAGGGALAAGVGALASVAVPARKGLDEARQAQEGLTAAVADFGRQSKEAARARRELDQAMAAAPKGAAAFLAQQRALGREWTRATAGSQADLVGLGTSSLRLFRQRALDELADDVRAVTRATREQGVEFARFLTGPESLETAGVLSRSFARNLDEVEVASENVARAMGRVAVASTPFLDDGIAAFERWTRGLERGTRDADALQDQIRGYVDDLRAWGDLTGSAFELARDVLGAGRPAGRSLVEDLTGTLDRWDRWVDRNPARVERFFDDAATDAERLARGVVSVTRGLNDLATDLRPVIPLVERLAEAAGALASLGPGAIPLAFGAWRGARGAARRPGGAPAAGPVDPSAALLATSAGVGASRGGVVRRAGRSAGGTAGRVGSGALRGAGRAFWPVALGMGALDFMAADGTLLERGGAAVDSFLLNVPSRLGVDIGSTPAKTGQKAADDILSRGDAAVIARVRALRAELAARELSGGGRISGSFEMRQRLRGGDRRTAQEELDALMPGYRAAETSAGGAAAAGLEQAFGTRQRRQGLGAARAGFGMDFADALKGRGEEGRRELASQVSGWIDELQRGDKSARRTADQMARSVVWRFRRMGADVRTVNEAIGSQTPATWEKVRASIVGSAELARQQTTRAFTDLQQQAIGQLMAAGYSRGQARALVRGQEAESRAGRARTRAGAVQGAIAGATGGQFVTGGAGAYDKAVGDGLGDRTGGRAAGAMAQAARTGVSAPPGGLMGANPGLAVYANDAASYGLRVSSGARPGAVTNAGNRSYHASGNALDLAGPADAMMRFARHAATTYGSQLEELIYSPMGFSIKDGRRVPPYAVADHFDHVHIADTAPGGAAGLMASMDTFGPGMQRLDLRLPGVSAGGVGGALARSAVSAYATGLEGLGMDAAGASGAGGGATSAGGKYARADLAALWTQAGGPPEVAGLMAAIALAESGGNPSAYNPSGATGLWQILGNPFPGDARDPLTNARMAVAKYRTQGLGAWEAYTRGMHTRFMGDGIGVSRARVRSGGPVRAAAASSAGSGGVSVTAPPVTLNYAGSMDVNRVEAIVGRNMDRFVDMLQDELAAGSEGPLDGAM